jgi:phage baseplate assembly protein W
MAFRLNNFEPKNNHQQNRWRDIDLSFEKNPVTNDLKVFNDVEAIRQAIKNIVLTNPWDRPFKPDLSCGIRTLLFEPLTPMLTLRAKKKIEFAIKKYEPRVILDNVIVVGDPDRNTLEITIQFTIKNTVTPQNVNISLKRLR